VLPGVALSRSARSDVPAVAVLPVEPDPVDDAPLAPIVAFESVHMLLLAEPAAPVTLPLVPTLPLIPLLPLAAPALRCRQPLTVTMRLLWLLACALDPDCEPDCAVNDAAQPSAIANVAPVHCFFIVPPHQSLHQAMCSASPTGCNQQARRNGR
jgi:hypothetical protein